MIISAETQGGDAAEEHLNPAGYREGFSNHAV